MRNPNILARAGACAVLAVGLTVGGVTAAGATTGDSPGTVQLVVGGLDNPRGLAFGTAGQLYIAEAGHGGTLPLGSGPDGGAQYGGLTGSLGVWANGKLTHPITGLFSAAGGDGTAAEGFVSVSARGTALTGQFALNTSPLAGAPSGIPIVDAARAELGRTVLLNTASGTWTSLAPTGDDDYAWAAAHTSLNPQFPDANPNMVITVGSTRYVADAGANALVKVDRSGSVSTLASLTVPDGSPTDAVATCVANAPDGSLYVTELLGGTFAPGGARIWQIWPNGVAHVKWTGFSTIQGCGFDGSGNFYVTEFQTAGLGAQNPAGALVKISPSGHRTTYGLGQLFLPSGFAFRGGSVYVSNWSIMPATGPGPHGEVVRINVGR